MPIVCPRCQTQNRDGARFCNSCATALVTSLTCPACGAENPTQARYCLQCAAALRGASLQSGLGTGMLQANALLQERYIVVRRVGQGGMGAVYEAADRRIQGKRWAIKEMSEAALSTSQRRLEAVTAFRQEAQMLAKLSHPNLPAISDYFSEGGKQYLVMEYVDGETLEDKLARTQGFLDEASVVEWALQICDVLGYLHSQQPAVIFRDLKPSNIMVDRTGRVKLIDFGIARIFKPGQSGDTQVMGTPGYAAPEQYGKAQTDPRSDVYSLGVTLHRLLTKYDPADTPFNLPTVRSLNPRVSSPMAAVIDRATRTDAAARYQSVREMRSALQAPAAPAPAPTPAAVPKPSVAQVSVAPAPQPAASAAAAPSVAATPASRQATVRPPLARSGFWGTLLIAVVVGAVVGIGGNLLPLTDVFGLGVSLSAVAFAAAGPLAAKLTRRPGAALLALAVWPLAQMVLEGRSLGSPIVVLLAGGVAAELIFLLGGYKRFGLIATILAGVAIEVTIPLAYQALGMYHPPLEAYLRQAIPGVAGGTVAWVIGKVFGR